MSDNANELKPFSLDPAYIESLARLENVNNKATWNKREIPSPNNNLDPFICLVDDVFGLGELPKVRASISMLLDNDAPYGKFLFISGAPNTGGFAFARILMALKPLKPWEAGCFANFNLFLADTGRDHIKEIFGDNPLIVLPDFNREPIDFTLKTTLYRLLENQPMEGRKLFGNAPYFRRWNFRFVLQGHVPDINEASFPRMILLKTRKVEQNRTKLFESVLNCKDAIREWALAMPKGDRDSILGLAPCSPD